MKQCDNGHFYDEARFASCPYCQGGAGVGRTVAASSVGKTVAAYPGSPEADRGKTVGIRGDKPNPVNRDGECEMGTQVCFSVLPGAVRFLVPAKGT